MEEPQEPQQQRQQEQDRYAFYDGRVQFAAKPTNKDDTTAESTVESTTESTAESTPEPTTTFTTIDPSTALPLCTIHASSPSIISAAVASAQAAFPAWAATTPVERARILHRAACLVRSRNDALARIETLDSGKPFSETSTVDVVTGADVLEYYASLVASGGLDGETIRLRPTAFVQTTKEPLGVCAAIGAWNYPLQIVLWKSAPCLAAGNTLIYKPSEYTPLHAQYLAEIYKEAGLPDGVFNVVYGSGDVGAALTAHPGISKVSFTGQVSTGRKVAGAAAGGMKAVTMELGGKSPLVVLPDADVEQAADGAMLANFFSSGQVCTNGTRVFVPRQMKESFEKAVLERIPYIRAGDLFDPATNFGPLSSKVHCDKVTSYIRHGIDEDKATLLCGGVGHPDNVPDELKDGYWVQPTVFTDCTDDMRIVKEEIFGPVMSILPYDTVDEAIERANATELGLAAGVFGRDISLCHGVVSRLQAGITWINTWGESPAQMAVGGWKQSGLGVENGKRGLEAWVQNRSTLIELAGSVPTVFAKL
jgi:betaine-aldehyde dehydrogenase